MLPRRPEPQRPVNDLRPERWREIKALLLRLFELPQEEHAAFLDQHCKDDPSLLEDLHIALETGGAGSPLPEPSSGPRLAALLGELSLNGEASKASSLAGEFIGAYRLVRELGHGGMGAIYLAERADGTLEHKAALKLIRPGFDTKAVERRFVAERQILARLNHDNIARFLDGGVSETGQPYYVMEYVEGERLTDYCDEHRLSIEARLALFMQVCRAVQYAHRRRAPGARTQFEQSGATVNRERKI